MRISVGVCLLLPIVGWTSAMACIHCKADRELHQGSPAFIDHHNAKNSLDVLGVYEGTLPGADNEGLRQSLELREDNQFLLQSTYLGKADHEPFIDKGRYVWDSTGNVIILSLADGDQPYFVGENYLLMLDREGNRIEGELAEKYLLRKAPRN